MRPRMMWEGDNEFWERGNADVGDDDGGDGSRIGKERNYERWEW